MKYLNRKSYAANVKVGDEVMFLADVGEVSVGTQAVVTNVNEDGVVVQLNPKTAYEQENASLRANVSITEAELNVLAFGGELQYEPTPEPKVEEEVIIDEMKDDELPLEEKGISSSNQGANLQGPTSGSNLDNPVI